MQDPEAGIVVTLYSRLQINGLVRIFFDYGRSPHPADARPRAPGKRP